VQTADPTRRFLANGLRKTLEAFTHEGYIALANYSSSYAWERGYSRVKRPKTPPEGRRPGRALALGRNVSHAA